MKLEVTSEKILNAIKDNPETKSVFESLFPEVFVGDRLFIKVGQLFMRKGIKHHSVYTIIKQGHYLTILNITAGNIWEKAKLPWYNEYRSLTVNEFNTLIANSGVGQEGHKAFIVISDNLFKNYKQDILDEKIIPPNY